jgi:hypothetical protein
LDMFWIAFSFFQESSLLAEQIHSRVLIDHLEIDRSIMLQKNLRCSSAGLHDSDSRIFYKKTWALHTSRWEILR